MPQLKHRSVSLFTAAALSLGLLFPTPGLAQRSAVATQTKTIAVAALSGYDNLLKDVGYVGGLIGMPKSDQMVEGMLKMFTQGEGLVGVDKTRPWGIVLRTSGMDFSPIVCLPVTDLDALLALGPKAGVMVEDMGDGVMSLAMQDQTLFVKSQGDWAFAAQSAALLEDLPEDPAELLNSLVKNYDLGIRLMAQNIPDMYKQMAVAQLEQGLQAGLEQNPDETDQQFAARQEMAQSQVDSIKQMIEGLNEAVIGLAINPPGGGAVLDVMTDAVPGSKFADQMAMYTPSPSRFSGFLDKSAAMSIASAYQIPAEVLPRVTADFQQQMNSARSMMSEAIEQEENLPNDEVKETIQSALDDLFSSIEAMVASGKVDMVGHVHMRLGAFSVLAAMDTPEPQRIDAALKKLAALAEDDPNFPGIVWGAETVDGVTMHTFSAPVTEQEAQGVVGDTLHIAVGIGPDAVYFSLGPDHVAALQKALAASAANPSIKVKPMQLTIALEQLMDFSARVAEAQGEDATVPMMMAAMLGGSDQNHVHLTAQGVPNGLKYQLKIEEGVLKALGAAAAQAQAQAQQGGQFPQ